MEDTLTTQQVAEGTNEKQADNAVKDFWGIIADGEIPAWWKVDTEVSTDPSAHKAALKRHRKLIDRLQREHKAMLADNQQSEKKRKAAADAYAAQLKAQRELLDKKEEEQRQYEAQQTATYERTLIEAQAALEERRRDNDLLDMNNKALQKENQIHIDGDRQQQEISHKIDAVMDETSDERNRTFDIEAEFKKQIELREKLFPMSKSEDGGYLGYFEKKYEAYDPDNVLEIKEVSLFNKDVKKYVLHIPSLSCKKGRVTVVQSYPQNLVMLERLLYRTTQSSIQMHTGEIRFEGVVTSSILREEYKKMLGKDILSLQLVLDDLHRSNKNVFATLKLKKDDKAFSAYLAELEGDISVCRQRANGLSDEVSVKIALAYVLSRAPALAIVEPQFFVPDIDARRAMYRVLNNTQLDLTVLILTENSEAGVSVHDARLYVI